MTIPSLQDLINDKNNDKYINKSNFIRYLTSIHCIENFEFLIDITKYLKLTNDRDKISKWNQVINSYLLSDSLKEINLPHQIRNSLLTKNHIPKDDSIKKSYKIIYELVLDNYNQFLNIVKRQQQQKSSDHQHQSQLQLQSQGLDRRNSNASRRNSVIEFGSRRGSTSTGNSGFLHMHSSQNGNGHGGSTNSSHHGSNHGSRRPSIIEYPKSPINNQTTKPISIIKLPSPQSDIETKKKSSVFNMKKFKFRRNSNEH